MFPVVEQVFYAFSSPLEGPVPILYPDLKGYISCGLGLKCDPVGDALNLPFMRDSDGLPATHDEIAAEWFKIKNLPPDEKGRSAPVAGWKYAKRFTTLHLTEEGMRLTLSIKLAQMERVLIQGFPEWETWSADCQLAILSMSWAVGPGFWNPSAGPGHYWPKLTRALRLRDYTTASVECFMPEERLYPGLRPRNVANRTLFMNAAVVEQTDLDKATLYYPRDLSEPEVDREAPTLPDVLKGTGEDPPSNV